MKGKWRIVRMPDYEPELQPNGSITGQICFHGGDETNVTARPWKTSSTAC